MNVMTGDLAFIPLGGTGEIGMNLNVYRCDGALLAVDCIASMGCDAFFMDEWGVDVVVAASQKGLMVPPGLGILWFSDKITVMPFEVVKTCEAGMLIF